MAIADVERRVDVCIFYRNLNAGGVARVFVELANGLAAKGLTVQFLLDSRGSMLEAQLDSGVEVVTQTRKGRIGRLLGLVSHIRGTKPRNLLTAVVNFNVVAVVAHLMTGRRTRLTITEVADPVSDFRNSGTWLYPLNYLLVPILYRFATGIVAVSEGLAGRIARLALVGRHRVRVVHNPIFKPQLLEMSQAPLQHRWADRRQNLVITAGRLVLQKNQATLLKAFAIVSRRSPDARLIVLGEGPLKANLLDLTRQLALDGCVEFVGVDPNPFRWFSRASVFALSSLGEGFGNVLVEAMACGCTPVSTDCRWGPREILANGEYGTLVPVGDHGALAEAILAALENPRDRGQMLRRATEFSVEKSVAGYLELLALREIERP